MVVRRASDRGRLRRAGAAVTVTLASCCVLVLLGLAFPLGAAASSPEIPPRPTWVRPTPPAPPTPSHPATPSPPSPSRPETPAAPSLSPTLSPRPSPSLSSSQRPTAGIDRPAGYAPNPAASGAGAGAPKPDREPAPRATANSHPNQGRVPASSLYASRSVAQSLIIGGLAGFTIAAIAMVLLGWVRRRL